MFRSAPGQDEPTRWLKVSIDLDNVCQQYEMMLLSAWPTSLEVRKKFFFFFQKHLELAKMCRFARSAHCDVTKSADRAAPLFWLLKIAKEVIL